MQEGELKLENVDEIEMPTYASSLESAPEVVLGRLFENEDGREPVDRPVKNILYRVHAQLDIRTEEGKKFGGSGTLVGPRHLLTVGHNLYNPKFGGDRWAKAIWVCCALDGDLHPFDKLGVVRAYTYRQWVTQGEFKEEFDLALFVLARPVDRPDTRAGWFGMSYLPEYSPLLKGEFQIAGYPLEVDIDKVRSGFKDTSERRNFRKMWKMSNKNKKGDIVPLEIAPGKFYYQIDSSPGQSGSGIWYVQKEGETMKPYVVGVHAYGEKHEEGRGNYGVRLTQRKFRQIIQWISETYEADIKPPPPPETIEDQYGKLGRLASDELEEMIERRENLPVAYGVMAERLLYGRSNQPIDKHRAFEYATRAHRSGDMFGTLFLTKMYMDGDAPGGKNLERFRELKLRYRKSDIKELARREYSPRSRYYLADVFGDEEKISLLRASADQEYAPAQFLLGRLLVVGRRTFSTSGVETPHNPEEGLRYLRAAVEQGHLPSEVALALDSLGPSESGEESGDVERTQRLLAHAARMGFDQAQFAIAQIFEMSLDRGSAVKNYTLAARQGHEGAVAALRRLGADIPEESRDVESLVSERGAGVRGSEADDNSEGMLRMLRKAAAEASESGSGGAAMFQYNLAQLLENNFLNIPGRREEAIQNYRLAARQNHEGAIEALRRLGVDLEEGDGETRGAAEGVGSAAEE